MAEILIAFVVAAVCGSIIGAVAYGAGQRDERRRWLEWVRPKKPEAPASFGGRVTGGYRGPVWSGSGAPVSPSGGSSVRKPREGAADA